MDRRIFHIKKTLAQSIGDDWSVKRMADAVRLSVSRLKQLFKKEVGVSPMAFLLELRLEKAQEMISDTGSFLQIKEIGVICGLKNDSHFTRDFRKKFGTTPTERRSQISEIEQSIPPNGQE